MSDLQDQRATRREYQDNRLSVDDLERDPLAQFTLWLQAAIADGAIDATAMALSTAAIVANPDQDQPQAIPSVRIVLLKHFDADGFCWYTDYRSQKGVELSRNPIASGLFYWREFDRQVRITGAVEKLSSAESETYFHERPLDSRYAAAASTQSAVIADRATLESRFAQLEKDFPDGNVPRPQAWGGYRLRPREYEFWQGREGRLHDRFRFTRPTADAGSWQVERLQP